jgi:transcriptional regulator with XRE-family HTH domain
MWNFLMIDLFPAQFQSHREKPVYFSWSDSPRFHKNSQRHNYVLLLLYTLITYFQALRDIIMVFFGTVSDFSKRLRSEIEYIGLNQKEFAIKAGIKKRALDAYLRAQQSMPPADTAVKIAATLGLSVEYLVTGKEYKQNVDISHYLQFRDILDDLAMLPDETLDLIKAMIKTAVDNEQKKKKAADL